MPGDGDLLDDLLMAALDRALALAEVDDRAVRVAEHLHLDVAGPIEVALEEQAPVAERRRGFAAGRGERRVELAGARARCACPCRRPRPPP